MSPLGELYAHVRSLALEMGVRLVVVGEGAAARCEWRPSGITCYVPLVSDVATYFTNLHELGHAATGRYRGFGLSEEDADALGVLPEPGVLQAEEAAWRWALEHALVAPDQAAQQCIREAADSYGVGYLLGVYTA